MNCITIFQPVVVSYRAAFFNRLADTLEGGIEVVAGERIRDASVTTDRTDHEWLSLTTNQWLFGQRFLYQKGWLSSGLKPTLVVLNLNPRFIHNWLLLILRKFLGKKTILWGHLFARSGPHARSNILRRLQIGLSDGLMLYVESEKQAYLRSGIKLPVVALGNSSVQDVDCRPAGSGYDAEERTSIIYVGRMDRSKKVGVLFEAFAQIADKYPYVDLQIVGDGEDREDLEAEYHELIASGRIHCAGWVWDPEQLRGYYNKSLISVTPGYAGLYLIQSFAHGVPTIVARGENHAPEIESCKEGFNMEWFEMDDPVSLASVLESVLAQPADWSGKRAEIANFTRERYTIEGMVKRFVQLVQTVDGA
jgi:glycosyltransferase involved in cell wall biosynthesis